MLVVEKATSVIHESIYAPIQHILTDITRAEINTAIEKVKEVLKTM
jgi:hypothetical protein